MKFDDLLEKARNKPSAIIPTAPKRTLGLEETMRSIREQFSQPLNEKLEEGQNLESSISLRDGPNSPLLLTEKLNSNQNE